MFHLGKYLLNIRDIIIHKYVTKKYGNRWLGHYILISQAREARKKRLKLNMKKFGQIMDDTMDYVLGIGGTIVIICIIVGILAFLCSL